MINNPDADIRLGDINSPAFRLASAVFPRTRVHNLTADFPGDVDDVIGTNFNWYKRAQINLGNLAGRHYDYFSYFNEKRPLFDSFFPWLTLFEVEVKTSRSTRYRRAFA